MRRHLLGLGLVAVLLATGEWLADRPPDWLAEDPLERPFGWGARDTTSANSSERADAEVAFPLDLNLASAAQLRALPGVGPVLARRIVARRDSLGAFRDPTELTAVKGIGPRTLDRIRGLIRISPAPPDSTLHP